MKEIRDKVQSALRNVNPLAGLLNPMQEETDAVMGVIREELGKVHQDVWGGICKADGDTWPCPTMKLVEES